MSTVYLGEQRSLGREVAIKVMLPDALTDEVSRRRFENEARTVARLDHPNIVGIHDVGRTGEGLPYYSMPHMAHGHLGQRDLRGKEPQVRAILQALLDALRHAHARGIVHRDVKAENVLFDDNGRPLLADFGIALRRGYGSRVTTAGLAVGSTAYMPPEQARGEGVDAAPTCTRGRAGLGDLAAAARRTPPSAVDGDDARAGSIPRLPAAEPLAAVHRPCAGQSHRAQLCDAGR